MSCLVCAFCFFFFFNDTATTEIYTLSLHDALPISAGTRGPRRTPPARAIRRARGRCRRGRSPPRRETDRKSTRLNSSHLGISYAVFCLKKKKKKKKLITSEDNENEKVCKETVQK